MASLGISDIKGSEIDEVNVDFIETLLDFAKMTVKFRAEKLEIFDYYCCTLAWQVVLKRWSLASEHGQLRNLRNVWEAAKLFLADLSGDSDRFCARSVEAGAEHEHVWISPKEFLSENVSREWRSECSYTRDVTISDIDQKCGDEE